MDKINFPVKPLPPLFCFGGNNTAIEIDKITELKHVYYNDFATNSYIPCLQVELIGNITITIDYETIEDVQMAIKHFKKLKFKRIK